MLGLNPGGDPANKSAETIRWHTNKVLHEADNWSAYRDESWEGAEPGTCRMQPRILHILNALELDPGVVPASNIIFLRSRREDSLDGNLKELAEACWPFHNRVIKELNVKTVLCFGGTAGKWVRNHLNAHTIVDEFVEQNNRRWRSTYFCNNSGINVVVAAHPSIADWSCPATDPSNLVRQSMRS
jgi:hypothetical protein